MSVHSPTQTSTSSLRVAPAPVDAGVGTGKDDSTLQVRGSVTWTRRSILFAVTGVLLTLTAFAPALKNDFVDWDDTELVVENPHIRRLGWEQIWWMFSSFYLGPYQPLPWLSLAADYQIWGMKAFGFHLSSLLWHSANVVSFFVLARRLVRRALADAAEHPFLLDASAFAAALVFGLHPLRVESVAWISERRDVLSGFFFIWTVYAYVRAWDGESRRRATWLVLSLCFFACSLLCKATGVCLAAVLSILDFYPLNRLRFSWDGLFGADARRVWLEKIPFLILSFAGGMAAIYGQKSAGGMAPLEAYGPMHRLALASYGVVFYIRKTLLPFGLSPLYEIPRAFHPWHYRFVLSAVALAALFVCALYARRRWPAIVAVWLTYLCLLLPVSGLAQTGSQLAADRYSYLPCMSFAILAGGLMFRAIRNCVATESYRRRLSCVALACFSIVFGCLTWRQTGIWHDTATLWKHALAVDRFSSVAYNNVAKEALTQGRLDESARLLRRALQLRPSNSDAHNNMAVTLRRMGRPLDAMAHYREAERLSPHSTQIQHNIGLLLAEEPLLVELGFQTIQDQWQAASDRFQRVLSKRPDQLKTLNTLGIISKKLGQIDRAVAYYRQTLHVDPDYVDAHFNLGIAFSDEGNFEGAANEYSEVLRVAPSHPGAWNNLALLYERRGDFQAAVDLVRRGLLGSPNHPVLVFHLGWLLATAPDHGTRNGPEALILAEQLIDSVGEDPAALDVLAAAYAEVERFEEAVATAERAARLALENGNSDLGQSAADRAKLYRSKTAFRSSLPN